MSSGTTDNSIMQSDELEELEFLIERKRISNEEAVESIVDLAENLLTSRTSKKVWLGYSKYRVK
jgi:hypothetical protein